MAFLNKATTLGKMGRNEEAIAVYDDLLVRFSMEAEASYYEVVATALLYKGVTLGSLGKIEDAISAWDILLARFGAATESSVRELAAKAAYFRKRLQVGVQSE